MDDAAQTIQPQIAIRGLHDSRDPAEPLPIDRLDGPKPSILEVLQSKLPADPNSGAAAVNGSHISNLNAIRRTDLPHATGFEQRDSIALVAEPQPVQTVSKSDQNARVDIGASPVLCPNAVLQPIEPGPAE